MKSIIEQASSIGKAVEKAWERAEYPQEFSVKIFQEAERGFLGFTSKPAKVGIFFQEVIQSKKTVTKKQVIKTESNKKPSPKKSITPKDLENTARPWIIQAMKFMNITNVPLNVKTQRNHLIITFEKPVFDNQLREKKLFAGLSQLLIVMLRNQLHSDLRDTKIIIKRK